MPPLHTARPAEAIASNGSLNSESRSRKNSEGNTVMADTAETSNTLPDPFDPASLRLKANFAEGMATKKLLSSIPVERPNKQDFIRVHPEPAYHLEAALIEIKRDREIYLVRPEYQDALTGECFPAVLFLYVNTLGTPRFWPVRLPVDGKRNNLYHETALEYAQQAMTHWLRVKANLDLGGYEATVALAKLPEPTWPEQPMNELLRLAFRDHIIDRDDHPIILKLRGEIA